MHECATCRWQKWGLLSWPGGGDSHVLLQRWEGLAAPGLGNRPTHTVLAALSSGQVAMGHRQVGDEARSRKRDSKAQWETAQRGGLGQRPGRRQALPRRLPECGSGSVSAESPTLFTSPVSPDLSLPLRPTLGDASRLLW